MPPRLFTCAVEDAGLGFTAVESLAKTCMTSITATAIRYAKFTNEAVTVIVSSGDRVDYCFLSERLRDLRGLEWLKKGDPLPKRSATATFNKDAAKIAAAAREEGPRHSMTGFKAHQRSRWRTWLASAVTGRR